MKDHVENLIRQAANAGKAYDAMQYAQAALNAANALCSVKTAETIGLERNR